MAHDGGRTFPGDVPASRAGSPHRVGALRMGPNAQDAARLLARTLAAMGAGRAVAGRSRLPVAIGRPIRNRAVAALANRLSGSATPEHRTLASALTAAIEAGDEEAARALVSTAARRPDLRAEKILSHKHRYLWLCVPKVASRSLIATLRAVDPSAELIRNRTLKLMKR